MATITIYPNFKKVSKKTGKIPMYVRILHQNQKAEASLKLDITDRQRHQWNEMTQSFEPSRDPLNARIDRIKGDYGNFLASNKIHLAFTARDILNKLIGKEAKENINQPILVIDFIDNYLLEYVNGSSKIKEGTKRNYRKSITHFKKFLMSNNLTKLELKEFNFQKARKFDIYLSNIYYEKKKAKMLPVSASSIVIKIKAIFEQAVKEELVSRNPFNGVKIVTESIEKNTKIKKILTTPI
jgi:hypothetical protein